MPQMIVGENETLTPVLETKESGAETTPTAEPSTEAATAETVRTTETPAITTTEKSYRFKSIDEYEKGYGEAERKMHEATQGQAALKKDVESLQQALLTLSQQQAAAVQAGKSTSPDLAAQVEAELAESISKLDFENDPQAPKKLSAMIVSATNKVTDYRMEQRTAKQTSETATHEGLKARLQAVQPGLEAYYDDLFLPTLDRLIERDPVFKALPSDMKFSRVVSEMQKVIDRIKGQTGAARAGQASALEAGAGMGKGTGAIPIKRTDDDTDTGPSTMGDDMKAIRQSRTLKLSAF